MLNEKAAMFAQSIAIRIQRDNILEAVRVAGIINDLLYLEGAIWYSINVVPTSIF